MSVSLNVNGAVFNYPQTGDQNWGPDATNWAVAVTSGMLQKAGGLFQLLADVDFGSSFGIVSAYYKSRSADISSAGVIRLSNSDAIGFRNFANDGNLLLAVDGSNNLTFNGNLIQGAITVSDTATIDLDLVAGVLSAEIIAGSITNALVSASAGIVYSKLDLTGSIVNADIAALAAIDRTKIASGTINQVLINDGSGAMSSEAQLAVSRGGTGLGSLGTANQLLGVNAGVTANEYKSLAVGTAGTDFGIAYSAGLITLNLPDAGASSRGVVSTGTQTFAGNKIFSGKLDVGGLFSMAVSTDASTTGANAVLPLPASSVVRITNASLTSIGTLVSSAAASGQLIALLNVSGNQVTLVNEYLSGTAADRILTGTDANLNLANNASIFLLRDPTSLRWRVIGGSGGGVSNAATILTATSYIDATYYPHIQYNASANGTMDSIVPPGTNTDGAQLFIENVSAFVLFLSNEGTGTAANKFILNSVDANGLIPILPGESVRLTYDITNLRWRQSELNKLAPTQFAKAAVANYFTAPQAQTASRAATYRDGTSATPVDAQGGTVPAGFTFATSTTSPLAGKSSFLLTKPAATDCQGTGVKLDDLSIDSCDIGKVLQFSFDYQQVSGTYSFGTGTYSDLIMYLVYWNGSAYVPLQPVGMKMDGGAVGQRYQASCTFQVPTDCVAIRPVIHCATPSTSAYEFRIDNLYLGRVNGVTTGTFCTDWITYSPTGTLGNCTYAGKYRRVGQNLEVEVNITAVGIPGASSIDVSIPSGLSIDGSIVLGGTPVGQAYIEDLAIASYNGVVTAVGNTLRVGTLGTAGAYGNYTAASNTVPFTWGAGDYCRFTASVPIAGWTTGVTNIQPSSQGPFACYAYRNTNQTGISINSSAAKINIDTTTASGPIGFNPNGAFDAANNQIRVATSGVYDVFGSVAIGATNVLTTPYQLLIFVNGVYVAQGESKFAPSSTSFVTTCTTKLSLSAGDTLDMRIFGAGNNSASTLTAIGGPNATFLTCTLNSGQNQITPNETVAAQYTRSGTQSFTNGASTTVIWNSKVFDSHNMVNTTTGEITIPVNGLYSVTPILEYGNNATGSREVFVTQTGSKSLTLEGAYVPSCFGTGSTILSCTPMLFSCLSGDKLVVNGIQNSGGSLLIGSSGTRYNYMTVNKVGNYIG